MKNLLVSLLPAGLLLLGLAGAAGAETAPVGPAPFFVANWNVENLYDTVDDPDNDGDDEFLPNNPTTRWTQVRYETKLDNLAQVINGMNDGQGPDILGLEEIENEDVLRDLVDRLTVKSYGIVHVDSPDPRGIDTAMLFNRKRFALLETHAHKVPLKWGETRDILHATLEDRDGENLHVLVNHWPSRGGGTAESEQRRVIAARALARAIERIYQREPAARIIILGDFNDEPSDRSIRDVLDVEFFPARSGEYDPAKIYNLAAGKAKEGQGSFFHAYAGNVEFRMYDQIMASGALLRNTGDRQSEVSLWVDKPAFMVAEHGWDKGSPVPTFEGQEDYLGGYSDHFPIGVRFAYRPAAAASSAPAAPAPEESKPAAKPPPPAPEEKPAVAAAPPPEPKPVPTPAAKPAPKPKREPAAPPKPRPDDLVVW